LSSPSNDAFVVFDHIQKTYDGKALIVRDFHLSIRRGEFLTLLGPSGSGKTTCLMMLAGFETPTGGEILIGGKCISNLPPHKRDIGIVFQNYALFPHMTVAGNLSFPLEVRGIGKAEREARVLRTLDMVQMRAFADRRPAQLSGGQQQRVALARALVFEPKLVLMDEPLGALDKQLREHLQMEIKRLHQQLGLTVAYVTHDQGEALTLSDRVVVLRDGAIQQVADPETLYERPESSFVAQFIGENNALDGVVETFAEGACTVRLADGAVVPTDPIRVTRAGERTRVSIRPERVAINPTAEDGCAPLLEAEVIEFIYMGDTLRTRLRVGDNMQFVVKQRNVWNQRRLKPGVIVQIGWRREDCRALDAPQPGEENQ
jgi:putative spermidine/putrescine transport system ATP-binding protein